MDNLQTLHKFFELQVAKNPHHVAVIFNDNVLTYEQLNQRANKLAHYLINQGMMPATLIAVLLERSVNFFITVFGIFKAGCAYIPLDTTSPFERIALILDEVGNPLLITSKDYEEKFAYHKRLLILSNHDVLEKQPTHNPSVAVSANHLAYVIYTSGSTGAPKGVLIEHGAVINYTLWFSQHGGDVAKIDFSANHAFDLAITLYLTPLLLGLTVVICEDLIKKDPKRYLNYLNKNAINFIKITPSYFKLLINENKRKPVKLPHLRKIMLGGENLAKAECQEWLSLNPHHILYNEYGPTETTVAVTVFAVDKNNIEHINDNIPIGSLATNTYAYLLDNELKPVAEGEVGELYIGGMNLARGYLNKIKLTQQYFIKDPFSQHGRGRLYKTGDLCRRISGNQFECLGRIDEQIKIRGFRIEPGEIEYYLSLHYAIKAVIVIASDHGRQEKNLIAYYILKNPKITVQACELNSYLKRYLPGYMIPAAFIKIESYPLNANGKLDKTALPALQSSLNLSYLPARSNLEKLLAQIWSKELGINSVGINDDFFELGGHSLSAARIITKINDELKIEISLHDFYENATIFSLISVIKKSKKIEKNQFRLTKKFISNSMSFPLGDFQFMLWIANTFEPKAKKLNIFTRKRMQGRFDLQRLNLAFVRLLHKHEVLSYHVTTFRPGQYVIKNAFFAIQEESLASLSDAKKERKLEESIDQLINYSPWPRSAPQILVRLFHLNDESSELQLCIPHIIADDLSPEILLLDLSAFYNSNCQLNQNQNQDCTYRHYLVDEQINLEKNLDRDINFWDDYLKDACLYTFPSKYVIKNMRAVNYPYSTYIEISEKNLTNLSAFCAKNHISILDGLCAIVALALKKCTAGNNNLSLCINRVKSTRENQAYDNSIGCFLRIEPIKLAISKHTNLSVLSQNIHQAALITNPYQGCPNLIKLASISTFRKEKRVIKTTVVRTFFWLYSLIFQTQLYYKTLRVIERLNTIKGNDFLININVQSSFFMNPHKQNTEYLFGFKKQKYPTYQYDLLEINNLLDISFLRMSDAGTPFLVISANLEPTYREKIGKEIMQIINKELAKIS